jgi:hypothetical protein
MSEVADRPDVVSVEVPAQLTIRPAPGPQAPPERCCQSHPNWEMLFDHLRVEFPTVPAERILSLLSQANFSM